MFLFTIFITSIYSCPHTHTQSIIFFFFRIFLYSFVFSLLSCRFFKLFFPLATISYIPIHLFFFAKHNRCLLYMCFVVAILFLSNNYPVKLIQIWSKSTYWLHSSDSIETNQNSLLDMSKFVMVTTKKKCSQYTQQTVANKTHKLF